VSVKERVCILAYDGLDIELVEKFNLPNLKQEEYGKIDISDFEKIATPILWGSFITGENLEPYFTEKKGSMFLRNIFRVPYQFIKKNISAKLTVSIRKRLEKVGILQEVTGEISLRNVTRDLNRKTIFDLTDDSLGLNIPSYNLNRKPKCSMKDKIEGVLSDSDYWDNVWDCFDETKRELLNNLDRDLVMAWFCPADWIGHIWRGDMEIMQKTYRILDNFAEMVKEKFDGWILIAADHGMKPLGRFGDHTNLNYGFYSSNRKLGLNAPKLTDFYGIIRDRIRGELDVTKYSGKYIKERKQEEEFEGDEEEEIKKRLRDLGYF
jgi:hypothetical protein